MDKYSAYGRKFKLISLWQREFGVCGKSGAILLRFMNGPYYESNA